MSNNKINIMNLIDPEEKRALEKQEELAVGIYSQNLNLDELRFAYEKERAYWNKDMPVVAYIDHKEVQTSYGTVSTYVFRNSLEKTPAIIFLHGGGYIMGSSKTHRSIIHRLATYSSYTVISIDYSLAPEAKFPQQLNECMDVLMNIKENPDDWNIDSSRISFCGDSAGASLSLALLLKLRDENKLGRDLNVDCLLLAYGSFGLKDSMTRRLYGNELDGLTEEELDKYSSLYLSDKTYLDNPYVNLLSSDLSYAIPRTYIIGAELDPLLDDSKALYYILKEHGVDCDIDIVEGVLHAFWQHSRLVKKADDSIQAAVEFLIT